MESEVVPTRDGALCTAGTSPSRAGAWCSHPLARITRSAPSRRSRS
ncbi:hypothetical protein SAMN05421874_10365 [Nonomuraea maritima]|uniref:Uncharacterized protein n=1 Tax=Nonomuraea maritima TaxID=683260 RepID=A0A1G8W9D4_9ACTN|nr:hypothetical protein [Nonomuraea maritima]SDJ74881.1 hypothetical protein SAMN05421874_10365 [Nonomuraea maritima]